MKLQVPCRVNGIDCEFRHAYCNVDCEKWKRYTEERDKEYQRRKEQIQRTTKTQGEIRRLRKLQRRK